MLIGSKETSFYTLTFFVSLLLSVLAIAVDPVVNNDGVFYLAVARVFAQGEWLAAVQLDVFYQWPFYSFLIGALSGFSGLSAESSAWLLNAVFDAVTVVALVAVTRELGASRRVQVFAAIVFLAFPAFNDYRSFVIRDHGYLACYALGLWFFLLSLRTGRLMHRLAWVLSFSVGILFRTEAVILLATAPLAILFFEHDSLKSKIKAVFSNAIFLIAGAVIAVLIFFYLNAAYPEKALTGLLLKHADKVLSVLGEADGILRTYAQHLHKVFEPHYELGFSMWAMLVVLLFLFVFEVVKAVTVPYVMLWWYSKQQHFRWCMQQNYAVWRWFLLVNVLLVGVFLFASAFLVTRYIMALTLTLLLCIPFLINWYMQKWRATGVHSVKNKLVTYAVLLFAVILALDSFVSTGASKSYLKDAGYWLAENTPRKAKVFSSNAQVALYSRHIDLLDYRDKPAASTEQLRHKSWKEITSVIKSGAYRQYDFLVVQARQRHVDNMDLLGRMKDIQPVKHFENKKGDKVTIFQVLQENKS